MPWRDGAGRHGPVEWAVTAISGGSAGLLAQHALAIIAVAVLLALWLALGRRSLSLLRADPSSWPAPLPLVTQALLGQGIVATLALGLGAVGLLRPGWLLLLLLLAAIAVRRELPALLRGASRSLMHLPAGLLPRATLTFWLLLLSVGLAFALVPPWEWDTLMYHLPVPEAFLRSGHIHALDDNFNVSLVGLAQFATLPLLALGLRQGPAVANAVILALLAGAAAAIARSVGDPDDAWWTLSLLLGAPALLLVATTGRIDVTVTFAIVVAHALLLLALQRHDGTLLALAFACFGIAAGMKYSAVVYVAGCVVLVFLRSWRWRQLGVAALAFGIALAPWLAKNWALYGNPFFPFGQPLSYEPWLARIAGSAAIPAGVDISSLGQLEEARATFNLFDAFLNPGRITIEGEGVFFRLPPGLLLLPLVAFAARRRPEVIKVSAPAVVYLLVILLAYPRTNLRYLLPAIPPLLAAVVLASRAVLRARGGVRGRSLLLGAALGTSVLVLLPAVLSRAGERLVALRWALGAVSEEEVRYFQPAGLAIEVSDLSEALEDVEPEARILMLWDARTATLPRKAIADVRLSNWALLSQTPAAADCLAGQSITHVLLNQGVLTYYLSRGASAEAFRLDALDEFIRRCLAPPVEIGRYLLFRVRPQGSPTSGNESPMGASRP